MSNLPSHRQYLTSLIKQLTTTSNPPPSSDNEPPLFPPSSRPLLLTLHVLFPSLLLPALDLLDRRLVTHLTLSPSALPGDETPEAATYIVKSLATTITRRHRESASKKSYVVNLRAWNCSCASFAFDAFPLNGENFTSAENTGEHGEWEFGAMCLDGLRGMGEDVPCCKHLLACLLAEQWGKQLGSYVERKEVSKEEFAGTVAGL